MRDQALSDWPMMTELPYLNLFGAVYELAILDAHVPDPEPRRQRKDATDLERAEYQRQRLEAACAYARSDAKRFLAETDLRRLFPYFRLPDHPLAANRSRSFYGGFQAIPDDWITNPNPSRRSNNEAQTAHAQQLAASSQGTQANYG